MTVHALKLERAGLVHKLPDSASMPDSENPDVLWAWLEDTLRQAFGIEGMFYITYPVGDAAGSLQEMMERALWKTTYPKAFVAALGSKLLQDERSSMIVLQTGRMCRWNDPAVHDGATPAERKRLDLNASFGLDVGACLPLFTSTGRICGGFGLASGELPEDIFYASITEDEAHLTRLLGAFDAKFRGPFASQAFHITPQEKRVLAHMAGGLGMTRAAFELGLSPKTVEFYLRGIREKTRSANTAEAVAKAMFFNIL